VTRDEILGIAALASIDEMFSWRSPSAKQYRDRRGQLSDDELIDLMLAEPRLIRRPILIVGKKVLFGFNAEEYRKVISGK
jgi:arsenate reductase-like glutaredoxin family protein